MRLRVSAENLTHYHPSLQKKLQKVECPFKVPYHEQGVYEADIELWEVDTFLIWRTHADHRVAHLKMGQKCIGSVKDGESIYLVVKEDENG